MILKRQKKEEKWKPKLEKQKRTGRKFVECGPEG